jgi:MFS family permease
MLKKSQSNIGWFFWFIAALFYSYEFIHRVVPSILTNEMRIAFNVNENQLGLIGATYFYAYAFFQLPAGILIDKYGARRLLILACAILTLGSFLFTFTHVSFIAIFSRFLIGAGSAFAFIGCLKIASYWLSPNLFPLVVGLTNLFGTLGALSGGMPLSFAVEHYGWQKALVLLSMVGLLLTFLMGFFLHDKRHIGRATMQPLLSGLFLVVKTPQSWLIALYGALLVVPIITLPEMWGVEYLKIAYQIPATQAASLTHTIFIGTAIGGPILGFMMSLIRQPLLSMFLATLLAFLALMLFIFVPEMPYSYLYILLFFYGFFTANMLLCFSLITQHFPKWAQGSAIGFTNTIVMIMGGLAQHFTGILLERLRIQHDFVYLVEDYQLALTFLPICLVIALFLVLFIKVPLRDATK